jgi:hypothetical protein
VKWFLQLGIILVVSVFLQVTFEFSVIQTGLTMIPAIIGLMFFSRRAGQLTKRFPSRWLASFLSFGRSFPYPGGAGSRHFHGLSLVAVH